MIRQNIQKGFSLVEMLVAVAIFAVISSILLANYPEFRSRAALDNTAHEIALVFREAQVYGISVRGQANSFPVYGVHFDPATPSKVIIFTDKDGDNVFAENTNPEKNELLDTFTLIGGEQITKTCEEGEFKDGALICEDQSKPNTLFTILFKRPNPDALFYSVGGQSFETPYVSFEVSNRSGTYKRAVQVYATGQIVVK